MHQPDTPQPSRRAIRTVILLAASVLTVALAIGIVVSGQSADFGATGGAPTRGSPAPDFSARTLSSESVMLSELRGKPVVLNFFAGWCSPCRREAHHLQEAYEARGDEAAFLGVTFQDTAASAQAFVDEFGLTFPIVLDESEEIGQSYHIRSFPVTVFIRPDGVIHTIVKGPVTREFVLVILDDMSALTEPS